MKDLSLAARAYISAILLTGAVLFAAGFPWLAQDNKQWLIFAVLAGSAAVAELFPVVTPRNQAYQVTLVFIFAGLLLLPPGNQALLIALALLPGWVKFRYRWYLPLFNIANFLIDSFLAQAIYSWVAGSRTGLPNSMVSLLAVLLMAAAFTVANHGLLAIGLRLGRGHSWRRTGLFNLDNLFLDAALSCLGVVVAILCQVNLWLLCLVIAPLFLIYRALDTPNLQEQARTDPKTGLYNARHFYQILREEVRRAARFERPLAIVMADMDLLRSINNTYGHLAGDMVINGVANIIKRSLREYDLAARFGGEEFAILLPECDAAQALAVAERIRQQVEEASFAVATNAAPIRTSLSLGVASFPAHGRQPAEIIHQADLAVYHAKLQGRNQATVSSAESGSLCLAMSGDRDADHRLAPGNTNGPDRLAHQPPTQRGGGKETTRNDTQPGAFSGALWHPLLAGTSGQPSTGTPAGGHGGDDRGREGRPRRASDLSWPVAILVSAMAATAAFLWVIYRPWEAGLDWLGLAILAALIVSTQSLAIDIYGRGRVSTSGTLVLAGGMLFGVPGVLALAPVIPVAQWVLRRGPLYRSVFDLGNTTLWAVAAVLVYQSTEALLPSNGPLLLLAPAGLAALTYYVVNVGLLSLALALNEKRFCLHLWNERFRWLLVYYLVCGGFALVIAMAYRAVGLAGLLAFCVLPLMLRYGMKQYVDHTEKSVAELERVNGKLVSALRELRTTYDATLATLSAVVDSRDSDTEGHSQRVVGYALAIARQLGLSEEDRTSLINGALLHDVGKIGVPDAILRKPGPLSPSEWAIMRTHPEKGHQMLRQVGFLGQALPIIHHHHERYDGAGYPDGLQGAKIPLGARIFAVADSFDAMTSNRPYRRALSLEDARQEVARCAGKQFDPRVVEAFMAVDFGELTTLNQGRSESASPPAFAEESQDKAMVGADSSAVAASPSRVA